MRLVYKRVPFSFSSPARSPLCDDHFLRVWRQKCLIPAAVSLSSIKKRREKGEVSTFFSEVVRCRWERGQLKILSRARWLRPSNPIFSFPYPLSSLSSCSLWSPVSSGTLLFSGCGFRFNWIWLNSSCSSLSSGVWWGYAHFHKTRLRSTLFLPFWEIFGLFWSSFRKRKNKKNFEAPSIFLLLTKSPADQRQISTNANSLQNCYPQHGFFTSSFRCARLTVEVTIVYVCSHVDASTNWPWFGLFRHIY